MFAGSERIVSLHICLDEFLLHWPQGEAVQAHSAQEKCTMLHSSKGCISICETSSVATIVEYRDMVMIRSRPVLGAGV